MNDYYLIQKDSYNKELPLHAFDFKDLQTLLRYMMMMQFIEVIDEDDIGHNSINLKGLIDRIAFTDKFNESCVLYRRQRMVRIGRTYELNNEIKKVLRKGK